eukprot:m.79656 g.79656  ORF g.79656 m.79656 type:complete len:405 (-) comp14804_c0_seq1:1490-2704(-)
MAVVAPRDVVTIAADSELKRPLSPQTANSSLDSSDACLQTDCGCIYKVAVTAAREFDRVYILWCGRIIFFNSNSINNSNSSCTSSRPSRCLFAADDIKTVVGASGRHTSTVRLSWRTQTPSANANAVLFSEVEGPLAFFNTLTSLVEHAHSVRTKQLEQLRSVFRLLRVPFSLSCLQHVYWLQQLWRLSFPDWPCPPLDPALAAAAAAAVHQSSRAESARQSFICPPDQSLMSLSQSYARSIQPDWRSLGFESPVHVELQGAGLAGLLQMLYFAHNCPDVYAEMLESYAQNPSFPVGSVALAVSRFLLTTLDISLELLDQPHLLDEDDGLMSPLCRFLCRLEDPRALDDLYCLVFEHLFRRCEAPDFDSHFLTELLAVVKSQLESSLVANPMSLIELRLLLMNA